MRYYKRCAFSVGDEFSDVECYEDEVGDACPKGSWKFNDMKAALKTGEAVILDEGQEFPERKPSGVSRESKLQQVNEQRRARGLKELARLPHPLHWYEEDPDAAALPPRPKPAKGVGFHKKLDRKLVKEPKE